VKREATANPKAHAKSFKVFKGGRIAAALDEAQEVHRDLGAFCQLLLG
jgi:hypothetical protein